MSISRFSIGFVAIDYTIKFLLSEAKLFFPSRANLYNTFESRMVRLYAAKKSIIKGNWK